MQSNQGTQNPHPVTTPRKKVLTITITAIFTALVMIATISLAVSLPASGGYFNLGEGFIYIAALLFGPYVGGFAGGVGAMLADLILGYPQYALGTLAIKFAEGVIVGSIFRKLKERIENQGRNVDSKQVINILISGFLAAAYIIIISSAFFAEDAICFGGVCVPFPIISILLASIVIFCVVLSIVWKSIPMYDAIISIIAGSVVMVLGYFFYSSYAFTFFDNIINNLSNPLVDYSAIINIPFDTLQCLVGMVIAVPVYQVLAKARIPDYFSIE